MSEQKSDEGQTDLNALHSEHLLKLVLASGQASQAWLKFLIAVEGGLAVGFGFLATAAIRTRMHIALALIICFFGIALALALTSVIIRHLQWSASYIKRYIAVLGNVDRVFPGDIDQRPRDISKIDPGWIAKRIRMVKWLIVLGWVVAAVLIARSLVPRGIIFFLPAI